MMKPFRLLVALLVVLLSTPVSASSLEQRLNVQPEAFSRDQLIGRWRLVAQREDGGAFEAAKKPGYIFLVAPENARPDEIELHSESRKWITDSVSAPEGGRVSARFDFYPEADNMASAIPAVLHSELEGNLKWTAQLEVHASARAPILKITFYPGEVRWEYDRISGEVTSHEIVGEGTPRELIYRFDPVVGIARAPTQRIEVLSFLGPDAKLAEGETVTPQILVSIPGQKMYPQAYLDEALAREKGRNLTLTITGEQSGQTATLPLESRGVPVNGEMRYGVALSRAAHPLGRAITLSPTCGGSDPYLYPPVMSWQWVNEFFATEVLAATRDKGTCVAFNGISGETVRFSIGEDVHYRVQWYVGWEDAMLAKYRSQADQISLAISKAGGANAQQRLAMLDRFGTLMQSDMLSLQQKLAVGAVYFAPTGAEVFATGILRSDATAAASYRTFRQDNRVGRNQLGAYYGLQGAHANNWETLGRSARDYAASVMPEWDAADPMIWLERYAVDEALMVSSARQLDSVMDAFTRDGFRTMVNLFHSVNLGGKVYSMIEGVDAFGNPMSDEAYWLNVVDVAAEFTMLGASVYEASAPMRFHHAGTGGKIARLTDGLGGSRGQVFKARMQGTRTANVRHFAARDPSGLTQIVDVFDAVSANMPNSIRQAQRPQIVINATPRTGPAYRLLPEPQNPIVPVRVTSPRRPTQIVPPSDPITEFGSTARVAHQAPAQYRASTPKAPDAVAGNFILMRQTGRTLTEAQGRAQLVTAMESLSDGQSALTSGVLSFGRTEPVPPAVFAHRMELQGIEVAHFKPQRMNMDTAKAAVEGGWTVGLQVKPMGGPQRRVILTQVAEDGFGLTEVVEFFDPTRGQVVRMDVDEFADLVVLDADAPVTTYRARDPMVDARRTEPVAFPAANLDGAPTAPSAALPNSVQPKPNSYFRFQTDAGEQVIALGERIGDGAINGVFRAAGQEGKVVRISLDKAGNANHVVNDWWARAFLESDGINPDIIAPIKLHQRRVVAEGLGQLQVLELVDEFSGTLAKTLVKEQGGQMTPGQGAAYVAAAREINKQGGIWLDGHMNNFTFIRTGDDTWRVQIFDPGGIYPVVGDTPAARATLARNIQTAAMNPPDELLRRFAGNRSDIELGFRSDFVTEHTRNIAAHDMVIPGTIGGEFDVSQGLAANLYLPFEQPAVRAAALATKDLP